MANYDPNKAWRESMAAWEREKEYIFRQKEKKVPSKNANKNIAKAAPPVSAPVNPYQRLQELYSLQSRAAQNMYNNKVSQYDVEKTAQQSKINNASNEAYQQAYLNYMMQKKEMPQLLAAMGISGGGAESTVSSMQNNYGQSRNKIDTQRLQTLDDLELQFSKLKSQAKAKYDKQMYEYELQYQKSKAGL